jgi:hypothetical protein
MKEFEIAPKLCYVIKNYLNKNSIKPDGTLVKQDCSIRVKIKN